MTLLVLVSFVVISVSVGYVAARASQTSRARELLTERAQDLRAGYESMFQRLTSSLSVAAGVDVATRGSAEQFTAALEGRLDEIVTSLSVLELTGGVVHSVNRVGPGEAILPPLFHPDDIERLRSVLAAPSGRANVIRIEAAESVRVIGIATVGYGDKRVIYAEMVVPDLADLPAAGASADGTRFNLYFDDEEDAERAIGSNVAGASIEGARVVERIDIGGIPALLVVGSAGEELLPGMLRYADDVVLALGLAAALMTIIFVETQRRRRLALLCQAQLEEQNRRLRELDHVKDELIAVVSHELRTPLTSIMGYLDLLSDPQSDNLSETQQRYLEVAERNSRRLLALVNDLLLIARLEAGRLELQRERLDFASLVANSIEAQRPVSESRGQILELALVSTPIVDADRDRITQVIDNLLSNATKFTPEGGRIAVRVAVRGGWARVEVDDNGIGITQDDQDHLFERFYRAEQAATLAIQGSGLGLAISRRIVEAHSGRIGCVSLPEREGSLFWVELPLAEALDGPFHEPGAASRDGQGDTESEGPDEALI